MDHSGFVGTEEDKIAWLGLWQNRCESLRIQELGDHGFQLPFWCDFQPGEPLCAKTLRRLTERVDPASRRGGSAFDDQRLHDPTLGCRLLEHLELAGGRKCGHVMQ